jgi:hypothetical protein
MLQLTEKKKHGMSGYHLCDHGTHWGITGDFGSFTGNFHQVKTYAIIELGFTESEIDVGRQEMRKNFHNGAIYGIMRRFMFTFEKVEKHAKNSIH